MNPLSISDIARQFESRFHHTPLLVKGCGRINLIGEHTDYNEGFVLPASINRHIYFAIAENGTTDCHFIAANLEEEYTFSLGQLEPGKKQWANYMVGILAQLKKKDIPLEGLNVVFGGNLPSGSGMSSSAALECGFALGLCSLFNLRMSRQDMATLCQRSSNEFMGIPSGIMDQFASLLGRGGQVIKLDCRNLNYEYIPLNLEPYQLVLVNSNISHDHATGAYSDRVEECQKGIEILQQYDDSIQSLIDVKLYQLGTHRVALGELIYKRCSYVVAENQRLQLACDHLRNGKLEELGQLLYKTHDGLRRDYDVSCPELDFLVDFAKSHKEVIGARMMGGGFGGCTLNIVHQYHADDFELEVKSAYRKKWGLDAEVYEVKVEDGTSIMQGF